MRPPRHLTLEERVGQMFLVGFQGRAPDREMARLLARVRPGGVVFSQRNISDLDQIYDLTVDLTGRLAIPPLLAIEHEGGAVDRLKQAVCPMPALGDLADSGTAFVRNGARILASTIRAAGFNLSLGPVLDLGLGGSIVRERTLAAGPGEVARLGRIQIEEFRNKRLLSAAGHFPGLGGAGEDPHFVLPRVGRSRRELLTEDVAPYEVLLDQLDIIRISHGHYPALGDLRPLPASLSRRVVTGLLRETVGFDGVVMTDDLTRGAVTSRGLTPETFLDAVSAGNDIVFFSQATPMVEEAFALIVSTAQGDAGFRESIDRSVGRIMRLKARLEFVPLRHRAHQKARLVRRIQRLEDSIEDVRKVRLG